MKEDTSPVDEAVETGAPDLIVRIGVVEPMHDACVAAAKIEDVIVRRLKHPPTLAIDEPPLSADRDGLDTLDEAPLPLLAPWHVVEARLDQPLAVEIDEAPTGFVLHPRHAADEGSRCFVTGRDELAPIPIEERLEATFEPVNDPSK